MSSLIGQSLGRYHILEQLGEGGMATVYKAYDTLLERDVAVKFIRVDQFAPAMLERILKRFEQEAKALAKLSHLHIIKIIDYGESEGTPYFVMEYMPGGTLKDRLGLPMPWQTAASLLIPIAQTLDYAHRQHIVHRDVKPSNILLTENGQPMLTDFGIAKILGNEETTNLTGTGLGVGTPEYMSPEQWTGQAGPRSDIYSLGVVFYEMVTGRKPYSANTPAAILLKQATEPLLRPIQYVPNLPKSVEKVLLKAMAKRPVDRYTTMAKFSEEMERLLPTWNSNLAVTITQPDLQNTPVIPRIPSESQVTIDDFNSVPVSPNTQKKPFLARTWLALLAGIILVFLLGRTVQGRIVTSKFTDTPVLTSQPARTQPPAKAAVATKFATLTETVTPAVTQTSTLSPTLTGTMTLTAQPTLVPTSASVDCSYFQGDSTWQCTCDKQTCVCNTYRKDPKKPGQFIVHGPYNYDKIYVLKQAYIAPGGSCH